jgi:hypothetical protein
MVSFYATIFRIAIEDFESEDFEGIPGTGFGGPNLEM